MEEEPINEYSEKKKKKNSSGITFVHKSVLGFSYLESGCYFDPLRAKLQARVKIRTAIRERLNRKKEICKLYSDKARKCICLHI